MGAVVTTVVADACAVDVVVNSQTPQTGFESGGTAVRITGINFVTCGVTRVSFGGADGTGLTKTATTIDVIAPRGSGDVTPTLHYESESVVARTFTYVPVPVITRLRPAKGSTAGGTKVIVSGSGFAPPDGTSEVAFASDPASPDIVEPSIATSDELVVTSPPGAAGPADVTVIVTLSSGETAESNAESFTFVPAPIVTSITPDAGSAAGGDIVEIIGANFQRGVQVLMGKSDGSIEPLPDESRFGENSGAPVVQFIDDTTIRAITPSGVPGTSSIVVLNPDGQFGALSDGYTYSGAFPTVTADDARDRTLARRYRGRDRRYRFRGWGYGRVRRRRDTCPCHVGVRRIGDAHHRHDPAEPTGVRVDHGDQPGSWILDHPRRVHL